MVSRPGSTCCALSPDVTVAVDRRQLRGAVLNLVDNAVNATAEGDAVTLWRASTPVRRSGSPSATAGAGIPAKERAAVLERFSRPGARDAGGSGLGLAIVKAVAEAHGGTVEVGPRRLGGAEVAIVFPISGRRACGLLIVEDDLRIVSFLVKGLDAEGYAAHRRPSGDGHPALAGSRRRVRRRAARPGAPR